MTNGFEKRVSLTGWIWYDAKNKILKISDPADSARFIYVQDVEESEICRTVIEARSLNSR